MKICLNLETSWLKHFCPASNTHLYFVLAILAGFDLKAERANVKLIPISFCPSPAFSTIPDVLRSSSKTPSSSNPQKAAAFSLSEIRDFFVSEETKRSASNI